MTNRKTTGALVSSVIALVLCCAMLVGSTFAWFTDSASTAVNTIQSGTLKVDLVDANGESLEGKSLNFVAKDGRDTILWEPGCTYELPAVYVKNNGNLALKYEIIINGISGNAKLLEVIEWTIKVDNQEVPLSALNGFLKGGDTSKALVISAHMKEEAGNEYQGLTIEGLGITVVATQYTFEKDSVDDKYDEDAQYELPVDISWYEANPDATEFTLYSIADLAGLAAIVNGTATPSATTYSLRNTPATIHDDFEGQTIKLGANIDLKNIPWTPIGRIGVTSTNFTYAFKGTFDGQNHTVSNLNVSNEGWAGLFGIAHGATIKNVKIDGVAIKSNRMAGSVVGQLYGSIENCHVSNAEIMVVPNAVGDSYDNGDKVGGIVGWLGDNGNNRTLINCSATDVEISAYRDVGGIAGYVASSTTVKNCKVDNIKLTVDQITNAYGAKDVNAGGVIGRPNGTVTTENNTEANVTVTKYLATHVKDADGLQAALEAGGNVVLLKDIALDKTIKVPAGVEAALYLNGKTISGTFSNSGNQEMFLVKGKLTVKDGSFAMTATNNQGWNAMATIFDVTAGGVLNMEGVTANVGGTDMNFVVHLNNWGSATLNVDNCDFNLSYVAVRAFNSGYDMNTVTIKNTDVTGGARLFWVHNYTAEGKDDSTLTLDIYGNNNTSESAKPVRFGFDGSTYYTLDGAQIVELDGEGATLSDLQAAAANGNTVIDANGANFGDYYYSANFADGTVLKNAEFTYFYGGTVNGTVVFENCNFVSDHSYCANFDSGNGKIVFNNCTFDGWASFGTAITNVEFNDCTFKKTYNYGVLRFYQTAQLNNCTFEASFEGIDTNETGWKVEFTNCTGIDGKIYNNGAHKGIWFVDGTDISDTVTSW